MLLLYLPEKRDILFRYNKKDEHREGWQLKLLIADRDEKERTGLEWLVRAWPIPFQKVVTTADFDTLLEGLTREVPSVCCIELDMIPRERWEEFRRLLPAYTRRVIGMTAEATFDRAVQAIELHAVDLWVKPASPDRIKRSLNRACRELTEAVSGTDPASLSVPTPPSYRSLFLEEPEEGKQRLMLLQPERTETVPALYRFLEDYPFHEPPRLFPLSDTVAAVFPPSSSGGAPALHREGYRLIREWSDRSPESLFAVISSRQDLPPLRQQYRMARLALQLRFYRGDRQVLTLDEPVEWKPIDPFLSPEEQRLWIEMLDRADRDGIKSWMQREFFGLTPPYPDPGLLRIRLTSLLAQLRRFMKSWSLQHRPSLEHHYHRIFSTVLYSPLLYRIVQELLLFIYALLDGAAEQRQRGEAESRGTGHPVDGNPVSSSGSQFGGGGSPCGAKPFLFQLSSLPEKTDRIPPTAAKDPGSARPPPAGDHNPYHRGNLPPMRLQSRQHLQPHLQTSDRSFPPDVP